VVDRYGIRSRAAQRAVAVLGACTLTALGVLSAGAGVAQADTSDPAATHVLTSEVVSGLTNDTAMGKASATAPMTVGVGLVVDQAARNAAYTALFTPGSPTYHDFYTPATFDAAFGVSQSDAQRVRAFATRAGLHVVYAAPDGSYLEISGTTAQVENTFSITEDTYLGPTGRTFTANTTGPTVPTDVAGVSGLTSLTTETTAASPADDTCESPVTTPGSPAAGADVCVGALTPQDVRDVYKVPSGDLGAGQKVAIFGEGELANVISDLRVFESDYSQPVVPVREVLVGDDLSDTSGDGEWDLDSQAITGMAPDLQELDFYFGSSLDDPSITATYEAWVNDPNGPLTGNSSFGGSEQLEYLGGFLEDMALQQAAMEGRSMFASAGDVGGSCLPGANGATNTGAPCVEYPAASTYVTGVGGTVLYTQANATGEEVEPATRALEYSWTYSGGGHSDFEPAPAWQITAFPTGTSTPCIAGNDIGQTCRGVPDVSALSGDIVTNGYAYVSGGVISEEGGTSLSSPLWAGAWANVQAAYQPATACTVPDLVTAMGAGSNPGAGFAQENLYRVAENPTADPESFFDVGGTSDSVPLAGNAQQESLPRNAVTDPTGYDYVSGLGSPILTGLIDNLDCDHLTATTPTVYPTSPSGDLTVVTYGVTPPYNNLSADGCGPNGQLTDPAGDATVADPVGDGYDLTDVDLTSDATSTTFATTVVSAATDAANDVDYAFEFAYGAGQYAVTVDTGADPTAELYALTTMSTPAGLSVAVTSTALAALTPVVNTTTNTISTTMPFATFNTATTPSTPYGLGTVLQQVAVFTNAGPATVALDNDYNVDPIDQADFLQCPYTVSATATPPSSLPEAPAEILLPIAAVVAGGLVIRRRNRRNRG
jgi:pseudomonalisin